MTAGLLHQQTREGVTCEFHRVAEIIVDPTSTEAYAVIHSFANADEFARQVAPTWRRTYRFARLTNDARADAYSRILALPEWAGAVRIIP